MIITQEQILEILSSHGYKGGVSAADIAHALSVEIPVVVKVLLDLSDQSKVRCIGSDSWKIGQLPPPRKKTYWAVRWGNVVRLSHCVDREQAALDAFGPETRLRVTVTDLGTRKREALSNYRRLAYEAWQEGLEEFK